MEFSLTPLEMEIVFWNGASQAGIFPVWYENDTDDRNDAAAKKEVPQCEHLHMHEWEEMTALLERWYL